jgi:hypothetical protein
MNTVLVTVLVILSPSNFPILGSVVVSILRRSVRFYSIVRYTLYQPKWAASTHTCDSVSSCLLVRSPSNYGKTRRMC